MPCGQKFSPNFPRKPFPNLVKQFRNVKRFQKLYCFFSWRNVRASAHNNFALFEALARGPEVPSRSGVVLGCGFDSLVWNGVGFVHSDIAYPRRALGGWGRTKKKANLVLRVSHLTAPWSALWSGKMGHPENEVGKRPGGALVFPRFLLLLALFFPRPQPTRVWNRLTQTRSGHIFILSYVLQICKGFDLINVGNVKKTYCARIWLAIRYWIFIRVYENAHHIPTKLFWGHSSLSRGCKSNISKPEKKFRRNVRLAQNRCYSCHATLWSVAWWHYKQGMLPECLEAVI